MAVTSLNAEQVAKLMTSGTPLTAEQVASLRFVVEIVEHPDMLVVETRAEGLGLDRPALYGFGVAKTQRRNAERLARAIEAGRVFHDLRIARDITGKTYLAAHSRVMARYLPSDLRAIGF